MKKKSGKKMVFLHNIIYPIRDPFFKILSKRAKFDIKVLFLTETSYNRKWKVRDKDLRGYPSRVLKSFQYKSKDQDGFEHAINPFVFIDFFKEKPDILVSFGWANMTNMIFILFCILTKRTYYIWCESTLNEYSWKRRLMRPIIRFLINNSDACIVPGTRSKEYIRSFVKKKKIIKIPNSIDNQVFKRVGREVKKKEKLVILYVGRFEKIKGIEYLLKATQLLNEKYPGGFRLQLVGYGRQERELLEYIKSNNLDYADMIGYIPREKLPAIYKNADIFVLPSLREPWGFVVNEAMAAGLPVVVSEKVGCSVDLVKDGKNGFIYPASDTRTLFVHLEKLLKNREMRRRMGKRSENYISKYTYDNMVKVFLRNIGI